MKLDTSTNSFISTTDTLPRRFKGLYWKIWAVRGIMEVLRSDKGIWSKIWSRNFKLSRKILEKSFCWCLEQSKTWRKA